MRRLTGVLAVFALMLGAAGQAEATLMIDGSTVPILYQGPADYVTTLGPATGESTITDDRHYFKVFPLQITCYGQT